MQVLCSLNKLKMDLATLFETFVSLYQPQQQPFPLVGGKGGGDPEKTHRMIHDLWTLLKGIIS